MFVIHIFLFEMCQATLHINDMVFMFDHFWKGYKSFINICYLHDFFSCSFHVILPLDEVMIEVMVSVGVFTLYFYFF